MTRGVDPAAYCATHGGWWLARCTTRLCGPADAALWLGSTGPWWTGYTWNRYDLISAVQNRSDGAGECAGDSRRLHSGSGGSPLPAARQHGGGRRYGVPENESANWRHGKEGELTASCWERSAASEEASEARVDDGGGWREKERAVRWNPMKMKPKHELGVTNGSGGVRRCFGWLRRRG